MNEKKEKDSLVFWFDRLVEIGDVLVIEPFRGILRRFQKENSSFYILVYLLFVLAILVLFFNHPVVKELPPIIVKYRIPIWVISMFYLFVFFTRIPQKLKETKYNKIFSELGIVPKRKTDSIQFCDEKKLDDGAIRIIIKNPGLPLFLYQDKKEFIESELDCYISDISFGKGNHTVFIDTRKTLFPDNISYEEFYEDFNPRPYEFGIGETLNGRKIFSTLNEMVHLLVAGETSGGKSSFVRQMLVQLLSQKNPLFVYIVDLKRGVEGSVFKNDKRIKIVTDINPIISILEKLKSEMESRLKILEENGVGQIQELEIKLKKKFPRFILFIDECAEIFITSRASKIEEERLQMARFLISKLTRISRATGIHLILATQKPSKDAIDMQTKDNMVSRLCFRVNNDYVSQLILNTNSAAKLDKNSKGRAIWKESVDEDQLQVPFINHDAARKILDNLKPDLTFLNTIKEEKQNPIMEDTLIKNQL